MLHLFAYLIDLPFLYFDSHVEKVFCSGVRVRVRLVSLVAKFEVVNT